MEASLSKFNYPTYNISKKAAQYTADYGILNKTIQKLGY